MKPLSARRPTSPAAIFKVPHLQMAIKGGGSKAAIFKENTARDSIAAAH